MATKWRPFWVVLIYRMVRAGVDDGEIARQLGVRREMLWYWKKHKGEVKEAYDLAKKERGDDESFPDWVFKTLSPELKKAWKKIVEWGKQKEGAAKIELMLRDEGKRVRQQLFLYALCACNFSPSKALSKVNLSKKELQKWLDNDFEFRELCDEVQWHKGNFFEEGLVRLVKEGNVAATLFANKTFNRERGYTPTSKREVEHSGTVTHGILDLADIMDKLSEGAKQEVLLAIREKDTTRKKLTVTERISEDIVRTVGDV